MRKLLMIIAIAMLGMTEMRGFDNWATDRANFLLGNNYPQVTDTTQLEPLYEYPEAFEYQIKQTRITNLIDSALAIVPTAITDLKGGVPEKTTKDAALYSKEVLYLWLEFQKCYSKLYLEKTMECAESGKEPQLIGYRYKCEKKGKKYEITFNPDLREIIMVVQKKE